MTASSFKDHFSAAAAEYARARPEYPPQLFAWIAAVAPARELAWESGCGSGQATRGLAPHFRAVHATDPSPQQIVQAHAPANVTFVVEPGERCSLGDATVDVACVAQALHWFDRAAYFAECARVLKPGGVLVAWGYQDLEAPDDIRDAAARFSDDIRPCWPPERALVDEAYASFDWPFPAVDAPAFAIEAHWPLSRLLAYFSSYSAVKACREATGVDPVAKHGEAIARAWGDPAAPKRMRWPMFVHARRKP